MTNAELAEAIERAQFLTRNTCTFEAIYPMWVKHLQSLLDIQAKRAAFGTVPLFAYDEYEPRN